MADRGIVESKFRALASRFDEATLRLWAAVEARTLGRGGVSVVAKAVGLSRTTIYAGLEELKSTPASKAIKTTLPESPSWTHFARSRCSRFCFITTFVAMRRLLDGWESTSSLC
jgi:hypothetical protein